MGDGRANLMVAYHEDAPVPALQIWIQDENLDIAGDLGKHIQDPMATSLEAADTLCLA